MTGEPRQEPYENETRSNVRIGSHLPGGLCLGGFRAPGKSGQACGGGQSDALQTALGQVPDGVVKESELEKEHGRLVWSFDITQPDSKDVLEVAVDAVTGKIVSMETESAKQESKEKD